MSPTRRQFLRGSLAAITGLTAACSSLQPGPRKHVLPDVPTPPAESTVSLVRPSRFGSLQEVIRRAVELAGGLSFIQPGQSVVLKPALNSTRPYPATTDPQLILIVVQMVKDAGGRPLIADRTEYMNPTASAFQSTRILDAASEAGTVCVPLEDTPVVSQFHPLAVTWGYSSVPIYQLVAEADHVINLCTPRTHIRADFTMAMKNLVGVVDGDARRDMHSGSWLKERIAEISLVVRPSMIIMDGRMGFTSGGPNSGSVARLDFIAAGSDPLAVDAVGIAHLRLAGTIAALSRGSIWSISTMRRGAKLGIGVPSGNLVRLVGAEVDHEAAIRAHLI